MGSESARAISRSTGASIDGLSRVPPISVSARRPLASCASARQLSRNHNSSRNSAQMRVSSGSTGWSVGRDYPTCLAVQTLRMLNSDDLASLRGVTVVEAEIHERDNGQVLRLRLRSGGILAISADGGGSLDMRTKRRFPSCSDALSARSPRHDRSSRRRERRSPDDGRASRRYNRRRHSAGVGGPSGRLQLGRNAERSGRASAPIYGVD